MDVSSLSYVALVAALTGTAAIRDLQTRRLPNWLTVSGFTAALLMHTVMGGVAGLGFALLGFAAGFGLLLVLWLIGAAGGGDVKLMGALGAWLGAALTFRVFLASTAIAAIATAAVLMVGLLCRGFGSVKQRCLASGSAGRPLCSMDSEARRNRRQRQRLMPYAVPVALGTWLVLAVAWYTTGLPW